MTGTTKAEVLQYYTLVKDHILEQLADRPATRKRWVHGTGDMSFFEKNASSGTPRWVRRAPIENPESKRHTKIDWPVIDSLPSLVWHANLNSLELHTPQWTVTDDGEPQNPDRLVIDLDPGPGTGLAECAQVAMCGCGSGCRTTGSTRGRSPAAARGCSSTPSWPAASRASRARTRCVTASGCWPRRWPRSTASRSPR